ncbi:MAG: hypothetical protein HY282_15755 [Nitrospirae bacterium]|nr:hypothetical protein [Candidatus Manganitrophaceae bacterium]
MPSRNALHETKKEEQGDKPFVPNAQPGILVLSRGGQVVYQNLAARRISQALDWKRSSACSSDLSSFSQIVFAIYVDFKQWIDPYGGSAPGGLSSPVPNRFNGDAGNRYRFRALPLRSPAAPSETPFLLILIEAVSSRLHFS